MTDPVRAKSVIGRLQFVRFGGERAQQFLMDSNVAMAEGRRRCEENKRLFLEHEWARRRLLRIFDYKHPGQWNGYLPERWLPENEPAGDRNPNDSPHRKAVVELYRDILHFNQHGELPPGRVDVGPQLTLPLSEE